MPWDTVQNVAIGALLLWALAARSRIRRLESVVLQFSQAARDLIQVINKVGEA